MRGPGLRLRYDVRRQWRCPHCGYERNAPATEVSVRCHCTKDEHFMKLVEGRRPVRTPAAPLDPYVDADVLLAEEPLETDSATATAPDAVPDATPGAAPDAAPLPAAPPEVAAPFPNPLPTDNDAAL